MFFDDVKKNATTIMGRRNEKGQRTMEPMAMKPEIAMDEGGELDGRHSASQEMIGAIHDRSAQKLTDALSNFLTIHNNRAEAAEEETEQE